MPSSTPLYCLDSSVYIDWLSGDVTAPLDDIREVITEIEEKKASLLVPVIAYIEVMEAQHPKIALFRSFLKRSNVSVVDVTLSLADKAEKVRSSAWKLKPKRSIKTADAIFIAASMWAKASMLLTRDDKLIKLSEHTIVERLKICLPRTISGKRSLPHTT
jgi:predicted nucleic acid-binding protein